MTEARLPNIARNEIRRLAGAAIHEELRSLVERGRALDIEFLLHLEEFDRRRGWERFGKPSLWAYLREELGLLDCAAARRLAAVRTLRRFPHAVELLRDGRLWMTTLGMLEKVLTEENADQLFASASGKSKREVEELVACMKAPVVDPGTVIEEVAQRVVTAPADVVAMRASELDGMRAAAADGTGSESLETGGSPATAGREGAPEGHPEGASEPGNALPIPGSVLLAPSRPVWNTVRPVARDQFRIEMIVDREFVEKLGAARTALSHVVRDGEVSAVLERALDEVLVRYGKRNGTVPVRKTGARDPVTGTPRENGKAVPGTEAPETVKSGGASGGESTVRRRPHIPAELRRQVFERDGYRCTFPTPTGLCGSDWRLQVDHEVPVAMGGETTLENLRARCEPHNQQAAREAFGGGFMARFGKRNSPRRAGRRRRGGWKKPANSAFPEEDEP